MKKNEKIHLNYHFMLDNYLGSMIQLVCNQERLQIKKKGGQDDNFIKGYQYKDNKKRNNLKTRIRHSLWY